MEIDMHVTKKRTEAERHRDYRNKMGDKGRAHNAERMRLSRAESIPEFFGVDSEGIGQKADHRAVLISCFDKHGNGEHYRARDINRGLQWEEVFGFLYSQYESYPRAAFVGFFLGYDFNQWLRERAGFPLNAAYSLLTPAGKAARKLPERRGRSRYRAVKVDDWEVDMLGFKRLSIRPRVCRCYEQAVKCEHKQRPWMHICDAGSFFQMSFLAVIDPSRWKADEWPVTQEEYDIILEGKNNRSNARLDQKMYEYNRLENIVLARVMETLARGFASIGIKIAKDQWYGPGATASRWLQQNGAPKRQALRKKDGKIKPLMPKWFWEACHATYYGGWFEIFSHGLIRGISYNYDINNAYPFAATKLPHICGECGYRRGTNDYSGNGEYVLLYCTVFTKGDRIGAMPYRDKAGNILRPRITKGWYWLREIEAAKRAGIVKNVMVYEWMEFIPCNHPKPFATIRDLYDLRLSVGKNTATGMAIKLNNNSIYGKFAQSIGSAPFGNWFYASLITSHCRIQILDAIGSHPTGTDSVLMVATDGVSFDSPHPTLPISKRLGEWEASEYNELVLFKPGVYWHREGKKALLKVKSRGVPKEEFLEACGAAEYMFKLFSEAQEVPEWIREEWRIKEGFEGEELDIIMQVSASWPRFYIPIKFRMRSVRQALNENNWNGSGEVMEEIHLLQDSDPQQKRRHPRWNEDKHRIDTTIHDLPIKELQTFYHGQTELPTHMELGFGFEGETAFGPILEAAGILRDAPANYDLPIDQYEWVTVWGGKE